MSGNPAVNDEDPYGLFEPRPPRPSRIPSFFPVIQQTPNATSPIRSADTLVSADGATYFPSLSIANNPDTPSNRFLLNASRDRENARVFAAAPALPPRPPYAQIPYNRRR